MKKIIIENTVKLFNICTETIKKIKKDLTIKNPKYEKIKKYSRYAYTNCSPYLFYFNNLGNENSIEIPCGYFFNDFNYPEDFIIEDNRVIKRLLFPRFVLELRDTQKEAAKKYLTMNNKNILTMNSLCVLPTGKGKSILALYLAKVLGVKTLIVVHKDDLVKGWKLDIDKAFSNKADVGFIKAKIRSIGKHFTIATVQTLCKLSESEKEKLYNEFSFVVQDECHHCPASSFEIVNNFKARFRLGLTATPERSDGLSDVMYFYFGRPFFVFSSDENDEDILPVEIIRKEVTFSYIPICKKMDKMDRFELVPFKLGVTQRGCKITDLDYSFRPKIPNFYLDTISVSQSIEQVCKDIISEFKLGHSCVVFFTQKLHCREYYDYLKHFIGKSNIVFYYGDNKDNDVALDKAKTQRKLVTLTTYAKATEGTNVPQWEVAFFVSSMANAKNTEQAVGRIRRRGVEKLRVARVYDYDYKNVYGLQKHFNIRLSRYKKLGFKVLMNIPVFMNGFNYKE